jgi:acyl carrier protein
MENSALEGIFLSFLQAVRPKKVSEGVNPWQSLSFDELALDSLDLTTLCLDIEDGAGVEVRVEELTRFQTLGDLKDWVVGETRSSADS